ncbi:MAG: glycoside hydrolase family 97 catalytic domain-containing protein [Bacteroidales bacterium]
MNRLINKYFISLLAILLMACAGNTNYDLNSPNASLSFKIRKSEAGNIMYSFYVGDEIVIDSSCLGYRLKDGSEVPSYTWAIAKKEKASVDKEWHPVWAKRSNVPNKYNQLTLQLSNNDTSAEIKNMTIEFRLYDDGLAFRYSFSGNMDVEAESELTQYNYVADPTAWFYNGEYENYGPVPLSDVDQIRPSNVTLKISDSIYLNIHEAYLKEGDPLRLASRKEEHSFTVASSPGVFGYLKGGFTSAWRVVMVGKTPGALVDSHLLELLNPDPPQGMDFSWVKPSVALWDWRINGAVWDGFTYSMSYPSWIRMIDFAAEQGYKYLVLDANWYGPEFEDESDPVKGDKAKDVQRLLAYGKKKGVGVWLYLNDVGGRKFPIEETLKQYGNWGAAGVKYGFMQGSPEEKNLWTQKITKLCAENHLLINFHDAPTHPYGQMRTWPNALAREFCHAQLDAHRVFTPTTFCTAVFVNMVAGPIDMNNGMFDLRQGNTTRVDENQAVPSTLVSEAARTLIVFSGATILPDIPEYYKKHPDLLKFISAQKMPWKESRTLAGEIGEYIVMMRQTDEAFLVSAATNETGRELELPLNFLGKGVYDVQIVEDGKNANYLTNRETYRTSQKQVTSKDCLKLNLAPGGGACLTFMEL